VCLQSGCSTSACSSTLLLLLLLAWCLLCCRTSSGSRSWLVGQTKVPAFDNLYVRAQTAVNNLHTQNKFKSSVKGMMHTSTPDICVEPSYSALRVYAAGPANCA
jgi:hypothetical protein